MSKLHTISFGASGEVVAGVDMVVCWAMEPAAVATTNKSPGFVDHHMARRYTQNVNRRISSPMTHHHRGGKMVGSEVRTWYLK